MARVHSVAPAVPRRGHSGAEGLWGVEMACRGIPRGRMQCVVGILLLPERKFLSFFCICGTKFFLGFWLFDWLILELSPVISPAPAIFPQDQSQKLKKKNGDPACRRNAQNDCAQV